MRPVWLFLWFVASMPVYAMEDYDRQQIQQRIKPVGTVRVQKKALAPKVKTAQAEEKKVPGQATYEQHCVACHKEGVGGAPKFHDKAEWKPRLAKAGNIEGLVAVAMKGLNAMPPKGTCQECSEKDMKDAIQYMLPES